MRYTDALRSGVLDGVGVRFACKVDLGRMELRGKPLGCEDIVASPLFSGSMPFFVDIGRRISLQTQFSFIETVPFYLHSSEPCFAMITH